MRPKTHLLALGRLRWTIHRRSSPRQYRRLLPTLRPTTSSYQDVVYPEVQLALRKGYRPLHIRQVYNIHDTVTGHFQNDVNAWLKFKEQASRHFEHCITGHPQRQHFRRIYERENMVLGPPQIQRNPFQKSSHQTHAQLRVGQVWTVNQQERGPRIPRYPLTFGDSSIAARTTSAGSIPSPKSASKSAARCRTTAKSFFKFFLYLNAVYLFPFLLHLLYTEPYINPH